MADDDNVTAGDALRAGQAAARLAGGDMSALKDANALAKVGGEGSKYQVFCCGYLAAFAVFVMVFSTCTFTGSCDSAVAVELDQASTGGVTSDTTSATIPSGMLANIQKNKPVYIAAATKSKIPWQIIAALHCREASCDPNKSVLSGERLGTPNPDNESIITSSLQDSADKAASHITGSARNVYGVVLGTINTPLDLQKAFVSYNRGYMYKNGGCEVTESPYALNNFDQAHYHMRWPNNSCEPASTRGKVNVPNGAYTIYVYLINKGL